MAIEGVQLTSSPGLNIPGTTPVSQVSLLTQFASPLNAPGYVQAFQQALSSCSILTPGGNLSQPGAINSLSQIGSFVFDYRENEEVELDSEITDHWLEDNTASQDHIGVKPTIVTLSGYVGELKVSASLLTILTTALTAASQGLSQLPIFLGTRTPGAIQAINNAISQAQNVVAQIEQTVARGLQLANIFSGGPTRTRQQQAFQLLQAYQQARIIFTVYTPYQTFFNMAIESVRFVCPPDSILWSKVVVRLKQMNFVNPNLGTPYYLANLASPVASSQGQAPVGQGSTAGQTTDFSAPSAFEGVAS